jgi:dissimilatory sulfite reductase (desulfoviridin) alpha/beta subunit
MAEFYRRFYGTDIIGRMAITVWAAQCKNPACGKLSAVAPSDPIQLDRIVIPNVNNTYKVLCVNCGTVNEFSGAELTQENADILRG